MAASTRSLQRKKRTNHYSVMNTGQNKFLKFGVEKTKSLKLVGGIFSQFLTRYEYEISSYVTAFSKQNSRCNFI